MSIRLIVTMLVLIILKDDLTLEMRRKWAFSSAWKEIYLSILLF